MLRKHLLPAFSNIATGETSVCDLKLGQKVHVVHLELGDNGTASNGNAAAVNTTLDNLVSQIRLKLNDKVQWTVTASQLNKLNSLMNGGGQTTFSCKSSGTAGQAAYRVYLPIFLAEPWRTNPAEVPAMAWNLNRINSCQIEVDLVAGLTTPSLRGFYEWEPCDTSRGIGTIRKLTSSNLAASGTGNTYQLNRKDLISQISMFPVSDGHYVNKIKLNANGEDIQDYLTALENQAVLLARGMSPDTAAAPRFDYVADYDDPMLQAIPAGALANLTLETVYDASAAGNLPTIIQAIGNPD